MGALRPALPLLLLAAACATPTVEKMRFEDAFPSSAPSLPAPAPAPRPAGNVDALSRHALNAALMAFSNGARQHRDAVGRGSPMPAPEVGNWVALIQKVDAYLARPARETDSHEVVRARLVMEAELELDARCYGEMPPDLADDVTARLARLATRLAELRRVKPSPSRVALKWPVEPVSVTSPFGRRLHPILREYRPHLGVDLAAEEGQAVMAASAGVVTVATFGEGHGNHVDLDHGGGLVTRYSHLSVILVEPGMRVKKGEVLGLAGSTGLSTGAHLHFEVWREGEARDPLEELGPPPSDPEPVAAR